MLKFGCAKSDITPDFPVYIRGYSARNRLTDAVADPLEAGVIALEKNGKKVLIITVDNIGIKYNDCRRLYRLIAEKFNINYPDILISCSHTHFAPSFHGFCVTDKGGELDIGLHGADEKYFDFFLPRLFAAIGQALANMAETELYQAEIPVSGIAFNRRTVRKSDGLVDTNYVYPENFKDYDFSEIDETLHVWKFMQGKAVKAVLARYGCHAVTGEEDRYRISADYPGYFKRYAEEKLHCPAFFMLGTAGDAVPMLRNNESRKDIGRILASSIRLAERTFRKVDDFDLKTSSVPFRVTTEKLLGCTPEKLEKEWNNALDEARKAETVSREFFITALNMSFYNEWKSPHADLELQIMQLGDRQLAALPFEVFTDVGQKIREACPDAVVVSCSGGSECYLPLAEDFPKGGYETMTGTRLEHDTGDRVAALAIGALKKI